jgi:hypothetical protein
MENMCFNLSGFRYGTSLVLDVMPEIGACRFFFLGDKATFKKRLGLENIKKKGELIRVIVERFGINENNYKDFNINYFNANNKLGGWFIENKLN